MLGKKLKVFIDTVGMMRGKKLIIFMKLTFIRAEATKQRDFSESSILTKDLINAAKTIKNHHDIIVRRADKSNIFVVMNRTDYTNKLEVILNDANKFTKINRNPINNLIIEVNKPISHINKHNGTKIINPIIGEFSPGYIYGTVKIHKDGNPLRPIISQIPTPIYDIVK